MELEEAIRRVDSLEVYSCDDGEAIYTVLEALENLIPKKKIEDKIKELEAYIYQGENAPQDFLQYRVKAKIEILKELLED